MEREPRSALLYVPDMIWCTKGMWTSLSLTLCSRHHMVYKGMWTSLSPTLCSRHHMLYNEMWTSLSPTLCSRLHIAYNGMWTLFSPTLYSRLHMVYNGMWTYSALLCVPDSIWRTMECELTQPCSVAEPSAACTHSRTAEGKQSIPHPAWKWPNSIFSPCLAGKLDSKINSVSI